MGEDRTDRPGPNQRRVTVVEAADLLGISEGAVRMRVKRRTLPSVREGGRLYVLLNADPTTEQERLHDRTHDRTSELIATLQEQLQAERQAHAEARRLLAAALERIPAIEAPQEASEGAETVEEATDVTDVLGAERARQETAELIATLHEGMAEERRRREEAERERDELRRESFGRRRERTESPETVGAQEGARRPWWRRVFGG